jgi:hypothetical protein
LLKKWLGTLDLMGFELVISSQYRPANYFVAARLDGRRKSVLGYLKISRPWLIKTAGVISLNFFGRRSNSVIREGLSWKVQ